MSEEFCMDCGRELAMKGYEKLIKELADERDQFRAEVEQLRQALHDAQIENSGQAAELERLRVEHRWIPVEERLPEENVNVLVAQLNGFFNVDLRRRDTKRWSTGAKITHWMPLPPLPDHIPDAGKDVAK